MKTPLEKQEADASDLTCASYIPAEHVYVTMAKNFPPKAIDWVRRAKWEGPVYIPWSDIDTSGKKTWAAAHQPEKVNDFKKQIKDHDGHVAPSVLVRQKHGGKSFIVDGHHRALAREELGQDVLAYVGNVNPPDYLAATEAHTKQISPGKRPGEQVNPDESSTRQWRFYVWSPSSSAWQSANATGIVVMRQDAQIRIPRNTSEDPPVRTPARYPWMQKPSGDH